MDRKDEFDNITCLNNGGLKYIQFNNLKKYNNIITHCFTTRKGGVSSGECCSLNFCFNRNDKPENVKENFKHLCNAISVSYDNLVFSNQIHENKVKVVEESDRGKGIIKKSDIIGYDALITNKSQTPLVTFYADCVPILLLDSRKKVIGMAHSGWRGTLKQIARETVVALKKNFGCYPQDLEVAIGPSIGKCCFEVGEEVYTQFAESIEWSKEYCTKGANKGKWFIDLKQIIKNTLINEGISEQNILVSNICTKCRRDLFFSHRGDNGKTGCMVAVMQLN